MSKKIAATKKTRTSIPQRTKLMAELLQEVNSRCPFCSSLDVGVFHLHHIDEDPSHHDKNNLLPVCPTCHAKIDKKDITMEMVRAAKISALNRHVKIEFVSAVIAEEQCRWYQEKENCFYKGDNDKPGIPVISFTLINHFPNTVVLKTIRMYVKHLPSGLSGIPQAAALNSVFKYRLYMKKLGENIYPLQQPLQIPAEVAAKFDAEVYSKMVGDIDIAPIGRYVLYFTFDFSGGISLTIPPVFLNCCGENEPLTIWRNIG